MASGGGHDVKLSKGLSWLLRHNLHQFGLKPTKEGYVDVDDVLKIDKFRRYTLRDVEAVVENNDKKRFAMRRCPETGNWQVRANQGHTIQVRECGMHDFRLFLKFRKGSTTCEQLRHDKVEYVHVSVLSHYVVIT